MWWLLRFSIRHETSWWIFLIWLRMTQWISLITLIFYTLIVWEWRNVFLVQTDYMYTAIFVTLRHRFTAHHSAYSPTSDIELAPSTRMTYEPISSLKIKAFSMNFSPVFRSDEKLHNQSSSNDSKWHKTLTITSPLLILRELSWKIKTIKWQVEWVQFININIARRTLCVEHFMIYSFASMLSAFVDTLLATHEASMKALAVEQTSNALVNAHALSLGRLTFNREMVSCV